MELPYNVVSTIQQSESAIGTHRSPLFWISFPKRKGPPSWIKALWWQRGLCNSMKLWAIPCGATLDRQVIAKSSDKSTGEGRPQHPATRTPWALWWGRKVGHQKTNPRPEGVQYSTGEEWKAITDISRKNEATGPKWKWRSKLQML